MESVVGTVVVVRSESGKDARRSPCPVPPSTQYTYSESTAMGPGAMSVEAMTVCVPLVRSMRTISPLVAPTALATTT